MTVTMTRVMNAYNCRIADCGDGEVWRDQEDCDDRNEDQTDDCLNDCTAASCGDNFIHEGVELCDDGDEVDGNECTNSCRPAECGDGVVWAGRGECDDENRDDQDACTNACNHAICGDGIIWRGEEECDDDNGVNTDACTNECNNARCGDGIVGPGEAYDAGPGDNDACDANCQVTFESWSGIRTNVALSDYTSRGWRICHESTYQTAGGNLNSIIDGCNGSLMMLACRQRGSWDPDGSSLCQQVR